MGGQVSEVSDQTTRVLLEVATWNGVNILRTSRKLGLRSDASNRFEKQLHPELAIRAQRIASALIVELCGAKLVPGRSTSPPRSPSRTRSSCDREGARACSGCRSSPSSAGSTSSASASRSSGRGGPEGDGPRPPPLRRHPRGRPDRGGGPDPRLRGSPAGDAARDQRPGGRLTREQQLRRRAEDVMRDLGFDGVVTLSLTDPGMPGRLRIPAATRGRSRSGSPTRSRSSTRSSAPRCSARCSRGPAQPRPRGRAGGPLRVPGAHICARDPRRSTASSAAVRRRSAGARL